MRKVRDDTDANPEEMLYSQLEKHLGNNDSCNECRSISYEWIEVCATES